MLWLCIRLPPLLPEPLARLAQWAQQWSSQVSLRAAAEHSADSRSEAGKPEPSGVTASLLWLEVGSSLTLFGGHEALCAEVRAALAALDYPATLGLAPTPAGAELLSASAEGPAASAKRPSASVCAVALDLAALRAQLEPLPLTWLRLPSAALAALRSAGLRTIGEVLRLPAASLARRFGPEASLYLQRLHGTAHEPLHCVPLAAEYHARLEFDYEVGDATALLFPLQRLLYELQGYLRARDVAVQQLQLQLAQRTAPPLTLELHLSQPSRDAAQLLALARERLTPLRLPAPTRGLTLSATQFVAARVLQGDLFTRAAEQSQQLQQVLDRLRARLVAEALHGLALRADYRPERAWQRRACGAGHPPSVNEPLGVSESPSVNEPLSICTPLALADIAAAAGPRLSTRPAWLYDCPRPLVSPGELLAGPERIESGWWDDADVARDYYLARAADGARQWVYQDLRSGAWYAHGLWA